MGVEITSKRNETIELFVVGMMVEIPDTVMNEPDEIQGFARAMAMKEMEKLLPESYRQWMYSFEYSPTVVNGKFGIEVHATRVVSVVK